MSLQIALLLIGLVIIAGVSLGSIDKARLARRARELASPKATKGFAREALAMLDKAFRPVSRLDFNPNPLKTKGKRYLHPDDDIPVLELPQDNDPFYEELERIEQAAAIPINVDIVRFDEIDDVESGANEAIPVETPADSDAEEGQQSSMPDPQIDFIIELPGTGPLARDKALGIFKQNEYLLEKPRSIYGLRYVDGVWSNLDGDPETTQYSDLMVAIQLVDKNGAIDEPELNTFGQLGLKLADGLNRPSKMNVTFENALEHARALDAFCNRYDAIAGIHVLPKEPEGFMLADIRKIALQSGMQFGPKNIFHKKNDNALGCRHMFSLANLFEPGVFNAADWEGERIKGLVLFMQIPCVYQPVLAFDEMVEVSRQLASGLAGIITDQDGKPLSEEQVGVIRGQIQAMAGDMQRSGVQPGSELALRLFTT